MRVQKSPLRVRFYDAANANLITGDHDGRGMAVAETPWLRLTKTVGKRFFGFYSPNATLTGSAKLPLDRTGTSATVQMCEAPMMYSTAGYAVLCLFEGTKGGARPSYNATAAGYNDYSSTSTVDNACGYFFFYGPSWREMIDQYTLITGRPQKLEKKMYGIHRTLYINKVYNAANLKIYADNMRNGKFPCDVLRIDCMYTDPWGVVGTANPPKDKLDAIAYVRSLGFRVGGQVLTEGISCIGYAIETPQAIKYAIDHGFDYAWYDHVGMITRTRAKQYWDLWNAGHGGNGSKTFVALGWATSVGQSILGGHTGDGLCEGGQHVVVRANLEQSLLGYHCSYTDLGEKDPWNYIGTALRPIIQFHVSGAAGAVTGHGQMSDAITEPWTYSVDIQNAVRKWGEFHYRFIPYLFTYSMIAHETGMPVWRAMVCHHPQDPAAWDKDLQAYVGEELLISPYYDDQPNNRWTGTRKGIWLPPGVWYDYFTGTAHTGPKSVDYRCFAGTTYEYNKGIANYMLPLFVKAGAIIPLMEPMQYIGEKPETLITLQVWPQGTSSFTLYEDETPVKTAFHCNATSAQTDMIIGPFAGSKYCPDPSKRRYAIELRGATAPQNVYSAGTVLAKQASKSALDAAASGWFFDTAAGGITYVKTAGNAATGFTVTFCTGGNCVVTPVVSSAMDAAVTGRPFVRITEGRRIECGAPGDYCATVFGIDGKIVARIEGQNRPAVLSVPAGLHYVQIISNRITSLHPLMIR